MRFLLYVAFLSVSLSSCIVYNATKQRENTCMLHAVKMHKTIVKVKYGRSCNSGVKTSYLNAAKVVCMGCVVRNPRKRLAIVYHCAVCLKLRRADHQYWSESSD